MYAVIKAGGKQHRVKPGDVIEVELMKGLDDTVTFHPILVVDDEGKTHHGTDIERAVVTAKPLGEREGAVGEGAQQPERGLLARRGRGEKHRVRLEGRDGKAELRLGVPGGAVLEEGEPASGGGKTLGLAHLLGPRSDAFGERSGEGRLSRAGADGLGQLRAAAQANRLPPAPEPAGG